MDDQDRKKEHGSNRDREDSRQIKEGAVRPVDNPKEPPPTTIEVEPSEEPAGSSSDSSDE